jgi:hypothetical protein
MEVHDSAAISTSNASKYTRVFPIIGLLLYYLGGLITSLDVGNAMIFIVQIIAFSIILIIGLAIVKKEVIILGEILAILGSAGPIAEFLLSILSGGVLSFGALGGGIVLVSDIFFILGILIWFKK